MGEIIFFGTFYAFGVGKLTKDFFFKRGKERETEREREKKREKERREKEKKREGER